MIKCQTKQWGNSLGIILPRRIVQAHHLRPHEEIVIEVKGKTGNVLQELFGAMHFSKQTPQLLKEARKELEEKL